ncbi:MAG: hypothetical protein ABEJ28_06350 [Salinigranum sp.]
MSSNDPNRRLHALLAVGAVALMVLFAGCSAAGFGSSAGTSTQADTPGGSAQTTQTASGSATPGAPATNTPSTTSTPGADTNGTATAGPGSTEMSGVVTVVVDGHPVKLAGSGGPVSFAPTSDTWRARTPANATLTAALASQNVTLGNGTLQYNGTTYREGPNTTVSIRVNREEVDPTTYRLQDGDAVWIVVNSPDWTPAAPREYLPDSRYHVHGRMTASINGTYLNFADDRFQDQDKYFHFENGNGTEWHAHARNVSLGYAMRTLGMNVTGDSVTYNGTTYRDGQNANVTVSVDGKAVKDPSDYVLKPGDHVRVVVERTS